MPKQPSNKNKRSKNKRSKNKTRHSKNNNSCGRGVGSSLCSSNNDGVHIDPYQSKDTKEPLDLSTETSAAVSKNHLETLKDSFQKNSLRIANYEDKLKNRGLNPEMKARVEKFLLEVKTEQKRVQSFLNRYVSGSDGKVTFKSIVIKPRKPRSRISDKSSRRGGGSYSKRRKSLSKRCGGSKRHCKTMKPKCKVRKTKNSLHISCRRKCKGNKNRKKYMSRKNRSIMGRGNACSADQDDVNHIPRVVNYPTLEEEQKELQIALAVALKTQNEIGDLLTNNPRLKKELEKELEKELKLLY